MYFTMEEADLSFVHIAVADSMSQAFEVVFCILTEGDLHEEQIILDVSIPQNDSP